MKTSEPFQCVSCGGEIKWLKPQKWKPRCATCGKELLGPIPKPPCSGCGRELVNETETAVGKCATCARG